MGKRKAEPLLWLLFSAGGLAAALLLPVLLVLFGLVFPAHWVSAPSYAHALSVLSCFNSAIRTGRAAEKLKDIGAGA